MPANHCGDLHSMHTFSEKTALAHYWDHTLLGDCEQHSLVGLILGTLSIVLLSLSYLLFVIAYNVPLATCTKPHYTAVLRYALSFIGWAIILHCANIPCILHGLRYYLQDYIRVGFSSSAIKLQRMLFVFLPSRLTRSTRLGCRAHPTIFKLYCACPSGQLSLFWAINPERLISEAQEAFWVTSPILLSESFFSHQPSTI